jgi:hypothetical protein
MKRIIFYYSKILLIGLVCSLVYFGTAEFFNPGEKKINYGVDIVGSMIFVVLPAVFIFIFLPNYRIAKWARMSHQQYISLSENDRRVLKWGKESEKKGEDNKYQQMPKLTKHDLERVLAENQ